VLFGGKGNERTAAQRAALPQAIREVERVAIRMMSSCNTAESSGIVGSRPSAACDEGSQLNHSTSDPEGMSANRQRWLVMGKWMPPEMAYYTTDEFLHLPYFYRML
jgi:hypothetical protein